MAKFTLVAVKGTDININVEAEMTPAEVAQVLVASRDTMKGLIGLLHEAKATAKEFYEEFKPVMQRRAAAALDRDGSSWVREEEMNRIKHEIEMEKLRQELATLKSKTADECHAENIERIARMNENTGSRLRDVVYRRTDYGTVAHRNQNEETTLNEPAAQMPNDGDFSRRISVPTGNTTTNDVSIVRINNDENLARRIAETTATTRDRD